MRVVLSGSLSAVEQMQRLLADEYQALAKADSDHLIRIAAAKQKAMVEIDESRARMDSLLAHWALPAGAEGMKALIAQCRGQVNPGIAAEGRDLPTLWQRLSKALQEVRRQNGINGSIIAESDRRLRDLLGTVRGQKETRLYGQNGRDTHYSSGRSLATL